MNVWGRLGSVGRGVRLVLLAPWLLAVMCVVDLLEIAAQRERRRGRGTGGDGLPCGEW